MGCTVANTHAYTRIPGVDYNFPGETRRMYFQYSFESRRISFGTRYSMLTAHCHRDPYSGNTVDDFDE